MEQPEAYVKRMVLNEFLSVRRRWARAVPMSHEQLDSRADGVDPYRAHHEPPEPCRGRVASTARIELGDSRVLRVTTWAEVTRDELIRIMNELVVGPEPDVSWLPR